MNNYEVLHKALADEYKSIEDYKKQELRDFFKSVLDDTFAKIVADDDYDLEDWANEENAHYYIQMVLGEVRLLEASICDSERRVLSHTRAAIKGLLHLYYMQVAGKLD